MRTRRSSSSPPVVEEDSSTPPPLVSALVLSPQRTLTRGAKRQLADAFGTPSKTAVNPNEGRARKLSEGGGVSTTPSPKRAKLQVDAETDLMTPPAKRETLPTGTSKRRKSSNAQEPRKLEQIFESPSRVSTQCTDLPGLETPTERKQSTRTSSASTVTIERSASPSSIVLESESRKTSRSASVLSSPETEADALQDSRIAQSAHLISLKLDQAPNQVPSSRDSPASLTTPEQKQTRPANGRREHESVLCTPPQAAGMFQKRLEDAGRLEQELQKAEISAENVEGDVALEAETEGLLKEARAQLPDRWSPLDPICVEAARSAMHPSLAPSQIVCRDRERAQIFEFLKTGVQNRTPGSMYVSGLPGTGKTLALSEAQGLLKKWAQEERHPSPHVLSINCMTLRDPKEVYQKVLQTLQEVECENKAPASPAHGRNRGPGSKLAVASAKLQTALSVGKKGKGECGMVVVVLDEMDRLISRDQTILYEMFKLASAPGSRCLLVGIANAIDLTERFLPKLRLMNCFPVSLTFSAYRFEQVKVILEKRLADLPFTAFEPKALELCARKVASMSGDMRKALGVCRLALSISVAEAQEAEKCPVVEAPSTPSPRKRQPGTPIRSPKRSVECFGQERTNGPDRTTLKDACGREVPLEKWTLQIGHMAEALAQSFTEPEIQAIRNLPQHHQMLLCAAVIHFRQKKKDALLGELQKAYCQLCQKTLLRPLTPREFADSCDVLVAQALLIIGPAKEQKHRRVTMRVSESNVIFALQGVRFFRNVLTPS